MIVRHATTQVVLFCMDPVELVLFEIPERRFSLISPGRQLG